jgi:hypothetical protein
MATEVVSNGPELVITLSPSEAANVIGLLAAQLAGTPLTGNAAGAAPTLNVVEDGRIKYRLSLLVR